MQPPTVMAFRKRLKKRGYTDISIEKKLGAYMVTAREPLGRMLVRSRYSLEQMHRSFRF